MASGGEWVFGFLSGIIDTDSPVYFIGERDGVCCQVDPVSIGQLVRSFKDDDGRVREVYEGDILEVWHSDEVVAGTDEPDPDCVRRAVVRWGGDDYPAFDIYVQVPVLDRWGWKPFCDDFNSFSVEAIDWRIIGNVHDNPEMMGL